MVTKTVNLQCIADTFIDDAYPNTNYGRSTELKISGKIDSRYNISRRAWPFFRFEPLPADFSWDKFISAEFGFYVRYFYPADSRNFWFYTTGPWGENSLTWNNRPSLLVGFHTEEKYVNHTGVYSFPLTKTKLQQTLRDGSHPEFMIGCNYYSDQFESAIGSREHISSLRPYIRVSYDVVQTKFDAGYPIFYEVLPPDEDAIIARVRVKNISKITGAVNIAVAELYGNGSIKDEFCKRSIADISPDSCVILNANQATRTCDILKDLECNDDGVVVVNKPPGIYYYGIKCWGEGEDIPAYQQPLALRVGKRAELIGCLFPRIVARKLMPRNINKDLTPRLTCLKK